MPLENDDPLIIKDKDRESAAGNAGNSADLDEFWRIFLGRIRSIIAMTFIGFIFICVYYFHLPNLYVASSKILAERPEAKEKLNLSMQGTGAIKEEDYFGTQIAILTGRKITELVNSELGKVPYPYEVIAKRLRSTRIIELSVTCINAEWAAKVSNKYSEVFVRESGKEGQFIQQQILQLLPSENEIAGSDKGEQTGEFSKNEFAGSLSMISSDAVLQSLKKDKATVESQLSEYSQRYKPQHPMIKELNDKLIYINNQINDKTQKILGNVRANLGGKINILNIKVLEEAMVPGRPSKPNRPLGIITGTMLCFFFSMILIFVMEYTNQKVETEFDVTKNIGVPFLGYIPLVKEMIRSKKDGPNKTLNMPLNLSGFEIMKRNSMLADAVASVRTHILFSMPYERSKRVMIFSAIPDEGKSTVAALFALSLASLDKKILLIDADLRRPFLHTYFNMPHGKGLTDYLVGVATLDEIMISVPESELKIISGGNISPNPSELLASEAFRDLLEKVSSNFDRVVIDVPPVLYIPDGMIVAKYAHCSVLVCGAQMVDRKIAKTVKEKFDQIRQPILGVVINKVNYQKQGYKYRYYKAYSHYYGGKKRKT